MKFTKSISLFISLIFWTVVDVQAYEPKQPVVNTKYGPVVGSIRLSRNSKEYMSFRGIPYAKPPTGNLRFKAPEPPEPWIFAVNATQDAPFCIQKNYFFINPKVEGMEDCLYLNIYVPKTEINNSSNEKKLLPVMVFIHWGGFFAGRGSSDIIGPEYLMDKDVVLVTFNYRLGVFGFLSTLDDNAPGNFGLKDQVLALKFVQDNIEAFGGNKSQVTIFGQSAGAGSVALHLVSPASRGLFQQGISQSGNGLSLWAKPLNAVQVNVTAALATFVGCASCLGNNSNLLNCLRKVSAFDLAQSADKFKYFSIEPLTPYTTVIEKRTAANPNPFLTKDPFEYFQSGEFQKVPWIVGVVQSEGILRAAPIIRQPDTLAILNANFKTFVPQMLGLQLSVGINTTSLYDNITAFYLGGKNSIDVNNSTSVEGFIDLYSDRAFVYSTYQSIILQSQKNHKPIWVYNFDYRGQYSYGDKFAATNNNINFTWGVSHCDDLLYLFRTPALFEDLQEPRDILMSNHMITLWTNFATYGDPDPQQVVEWKSLHFSDSDEIKNENIKFLNISTSSQDKNITFTIQNGFYTDRMKFWANQNLAENFPGLR